jgi:hypothetical protein
MVLAATLFFVAGVLNGVYPGGSGWEAHGGYGWLTYLFGLLNLLVAVWIWRGSERGLVTRIVLGAVFLAIVAALALAQPTTASLVLYVITGVIELVILLNAIRVWQAARDAESGSVDELLSLDAPLPVSRSPQPSLLVAPVTPARAPVEPFSAAMAWALGVLPLALALALVADAALAGYVPGGLSWNFSPERAGWLAYLLALVELVIAVRAVHGSLLAVRVLLAMSLVIVFERVYAPLAFGVGDGMDVGLHAVAAALGFATAIVCALALRSAARRESRPRPLERVTSAE